MPLASTMPRRRGSALCSLRTCFNDAPANCRGRLTITRVGDIAFNDAANYPEVSATASSTWRASTMPRRIAGERRHDHHALGTHRLQRCGEFDLMNSFLNSPMALQRCPGELPGETWWARCRLPALGCASTMPRLAGGIGPVFARHRASTMPRRIAQKETFQTMPRRIAIGELRRNAIPLLQRCPGELPGETDERVQPHGVPRSTDAVSLQRCPGELPGETAWLQPIVYLSETAQIASAAETSHGPRPERLVLVCRLSKNMMHLNEL